MNKRSWVLATAVQTLVVTLVVVLVAVPRGAAAPTARADAQEATGTRPAGRIDVTTSISLDEARVIVDAAVANARAAGGHPTIVVVDDHGDVVSMDRMDGTTTFFTRFAEGKARAAVALQQPTEETADQYGSNPQRFLSALSMFSGELILIRGGVPLFDGNRLVGGVASAGFGPNGDEPAVLAGIAAWEQYRQAHGR
jgi:glc operon protein GlcG